MNTVITGTLAILLYFVGGAVQLAGLKRAIPSQRAIVIGSGILAIIAHCIFSYQEIYTEAGINMGFFSMATVIALSIAGIVLLSSLKRPVDNLFIGLFPLAIITIVCALVARDTYTPRTDLSLGILTHIVLSVVAYSLLTIAALQALLLSFGDYELRHRKISVLKHLPPLQTMDALLFEMLWAGLVFLTLSISTGFIFLKQSTNPGLIHHTIITMAAWVVFAVLLWGRYQLGWRGAIASRWTLSGFLLLAVGYFGTKFVLQLILGKV
ncbi:MAG: cytochrome c biogenesis protein CcsA [Pseudomonadales bacterium]|nr:cytochrome c biogenesis protein CcsA [Pseudomonadales bacterium]